MNINNPWIVGIGLMLIATLMGWMKRDLPDKKAPSLDWAEVYRKEHKLPEGAVCWPVIAEYEGRYYEPVYFYPYRFWFRRKIVYKEHILCYSKKYKKGK